MPIAIAFPVVCNLLLAAPFRISIAFHRSCTITIVFITTTTIIMASNPYDAQASTNYKEAFSLFDKRGNGRVSLDNLGDLLRACGQNPTMTEIRDLEKTVGGDCECDS